MADINAKVAALLPFNPELSDIYRSLYLEQNRAARAIVRQQDFLLALAKRGLESAENNSGAPDPDKMLDGLFQLQHGALNKGNFIDDFPIAIDAAILSSPILVQMGQGISRSLSVWFCRLSDKADFVLDIIVLEMYVGFLLDGNELPFLVSIRNYPEWVFPIASFQQASCLVRLLRPSSIPSPDCYGPSLRLLVQRLIGAAPPGLHAG